jgi:hypothetical protein
MKNLSKTNKHPQLISVLWLRRGIGIVGILFPILLFFGVRYWGNCPEIQSSISDYYHTNMRDFYVGFLCIIALFLFIYKGYSGSDDLIANMTSACALGAAFFPTSLKRKAENCFTCTVKTSDMLHNIFASLFFLLLVYFCLILFPKTEQGEIPTPQKIKRNTIYRICGYIMLTCILFTGLFMLFGAKIEAIKNLPLIFLFEWLALWAFGVSWIVKGEWLLADQNEK